MLSFLTISATEPQQTQPQSKPAINSTIPWQNIDADALEMRGRNMRRVGVSLLVPGLALTVFGTIALIIAAVDGDDSMTVGGALLGGSMAFNIPAAAFIVTGGGRIRDAKRIRKARQNQSVGFAPIISPKRKLYGASLAINF